MKPSAMQRFAPIAAVIGLFGFLTAGGTWIVTQAFDVYVQAALAVGVLGLALAGLMNPGAIQSFIFSRQGRYGGNALLMVLAGVGIAVLVNYLAARNPYSWDLSEDKQGSLAPETVEAIKKLPQPVQAIYFYSSFGASTLPSTVDMLDRYRKASNGNLTFETHNAESEPLIAQRYEVERTGLLLLMGDQRQFVTSVSETEITAGLLRLLKPNNTTIYMLTGHGEHDTALGAQDSMGDVASTLTGQNYTLAPLNLQVSSVPTDARALVLAGPVFPVTADEVTKLQAYADQGGALVILLDPKINDGRVQTTLSDTEPLVDYLSSMWGITLGQDLIVDPQNAAAIQGQALPYVPFSGGYGTHQITNRMQNQSTLFPFARSVSIPSDPTARPGFIYSPLVNISGAGWGETDFASIEQAQEAFDAQDTPNPVYLAVAAENTTTGARLVVFGDSDFATDLWTSQVPPNTSLLVNSINWAAQEETLLNLTPKTPTQRMMKPTNILTAGFVVLVVGFIIPLSVLVLGGITWYLRRRHV